MKKGKSLSSKEKKNKRFWGKRDEPNKKFFLQLNINNILPNCIDARRFHYTSGNTQGLWLRD